MNNRPNTALWAQPGADELDVPPVAWRLQTRLVVRTKYLSEYVSVWEDAGQAGDLGVIAAELASDLGALHFRLAEPKESLAAEWVVLPAGVVDESVIRVQARRVGQSG